MHALVCSCWKLNTDAWTLKKKKKPSCISEWGICLLLTNLYVLEENFIELIGTTRTVICTHHHLYSWHQQYSQRSQWALLSFCWRRKTGAPPGWILVGCSRKSEDLFAGKIFLKDLLVCGNCDLLKWWTKRMKRTPRRRRIFLENANR